MSSAREQEWEYRNRIYSARNDPVANNFTRMLELVADKALKSMAGCEMNELDRLQGRYAAYKEVLKWINEPLQVPPPVDKP